MAITRSLEEQHKLTLQAHEKPKKFTLDGRLVGDLGEVLVAQDFDVKLYNGLVKYYDGQTSCKKKVQIKTTMKSSLTFPCVHVPDYYFGIQIFAEEAFNQDSQLYDVIFNGPGQIIKDHIIQRKPASNNLHSISVNTLRSLNKQVLESQRVKSREELAAS